MRPRGQSAWDLPPSEPETAAPPSFGEGRRRARRPESLLFAALALSFSLHLATVAGMAMAAWLSREREQAAPKPATFEIVDAAELGYKAPVSPILDTQPIDVPEKAQLVDVAASAEKEDAPKDARFLAEHDRSTEEETRARNTALTPEVLADQFRGLGRDPGADSATQGSNGPGESAGADERTAKLAGEKRIGDLLTNDPFGIRARPVAAGEQGADRGMIAAGNGAKVAMAGAPNNDYLPQVKEGDATLLNAKAVFFASFWNRVLKQVEPFWAQNVRSTSPGGLQKRDYRTDVNVVLSPKGELIAVEIVRSCGIPAWDRAVQEAFAEGAPFLNPPKELVSADGRIYMDDLGFVVSLIGGAHVQMYGDPRSGKLFPGVREGYGPSR